MKLALAYPGHYTSTYDVAHGYEAALRQCRVEVKAFGYHSCLAFYHVALAAWAERNAKFTCNTEAYQCYLAARAGVADLVEDEPDAALVVYGLNMHPCYYAALHKLGIPFALLLTESPYQDATQVKLCEMAQPNAVLVNEKGSVSKHRNWNAFYLPQSYDPAVHCGDADAERPVDVTFVGTMYPERRRLMDAVDWTGIVTKFITPDMKREGARLSNQDVAALYRQSKIVIDLARTVRGYNEQDQHIAGAEAWSIGARAYEVPACGALLLAQGGRTEVQDVFGYDVPIFIDANGLEEIARYYLAHDTERREMAQRQQAKARPCSFAERAKEIVIPVLEGMKQ